MYLLYLNNKINYTIRYQKKYIIFILSYLVGIVRLIYGMKYFLEI